MPETTVALYDQATAVILEREGIAILKRKLANTSGSFKALNGWGRIRGKSVPLDGMVQAVFFEAHAAERRVITTFHLEEAALGLFAPEVLAAIRCDLPHFEGRAAKGHYVEILAGPHIGMRGVVSARPFRVVLSDGRMSDMLREVDFRSSGLDEASGRQFETSQRAKRRAAVSAACANLPAELRETLQAMLRRVAADKLPLFTLLQSEPYQMQSSHLSFQEYYTARSIADGRRLPPNVGAPWRWSSWWRNTLRLGAEMGDRFGRGLLRAVSDESDGAVSGGRAVSGEGSSPELTKPRSELSTRSELDLELKGKIGGDLPTSMLAVAQLMRATLAIGLGGNKLGADELLMVAEGLRRSTCLTQLDLSANRLCGVWFERGDFCGEYTSRGLVGLATALRASQCLTKLDLSQNSLGVSYLHGVRIASMEGLVGLADAVSKCASLKKLGIAYNGIGAMGGKAIAEAFGRNPSLAELDISGNLVGLKGGKAIADAIAANPSFTYCDLRFNSLDEDTRMLLRDLSRQTVKVIL